jgi:hypothetical protein
LLICDTIGCLLLLFLFGSDIFSGPVDWIMLVAGYHEWFILYFCWNCRNIGESWCRFSLSHHVGSIVMSLMFLWSSATTSLSGWNSCMCSAWSLHLILMVWADCLLYIDCIHTGCTIHLGS